MRIAPFILLATMLLAAIPPVQGGEVGRNGFEIGVSVLVENCSKYEYGFPSIDGDIIAWTKYDYWTEGDGYFEKVNVCWMNINDRIVHNITIDEYNVLPSVSSERIAFSGSNGSAYVLDTRNGSIEKVRERGAHSYGLEGDILFSRNSTNEGVDIFYLGNRTLRTIDLHCSDIDLSGNSLCYIQFDDREVCVMDLASGAKRVVWQGIGDFHDIHISGQRLLWDYYGGEYSRYRLLLYDPEYGLKNITDPDQMSARSIALSNDYVVWSGRWRVDNVSTNLFIYDIGSGIMQEIFANSSWEEGPVISGNRIVYYRNRDDSCDLMLAEVITTPDHPSEVRDRPGIGSVFAPVLVLDLGLVILCLCLALLPERSQWRSMLRRRTGWAGEGER
jgi:hypothetical protein